LAARKSLPSSRLTIDGFQVFTLKAALQAAAGKLANLSPALYMRALDLLCAKSGEAIWLMEQKSESNQ